MEARGVETVARHGYRFAADVSVLAPAETAPGPAGPPDGTESRAGVARTSNGWRLAGLAGAALLLLLASWASLTLLRSPEPARRDRTDAAAVPLTAYQGAQVVPSLSPDGSQVAFAWDGPGQDNRDIYVKLVGPGEALRLTRDAAREDRPAWSPDGRQIAFLRFVGDTFADIFVVPALGGAERRVASMEVPAASGRAREVSMIAWTPDGQGLVIGGRPLPADPTGLWIVAVDDGTFRRLTAAPEQRYGAFGDVSPVFSADGRAIAFVRETTLSNNAVYVMPVSPGVTPQGPPVKVAGDPRRGVLGLAWTADDRGLMFSSGGHMGQSRLYRVGLTPDRRRAAGPPQPLPFGDQAVAISISRNGRLVYAAQFRDTRFWRLRVRPGLMEPDDPHLDDSTFDEHTPSYSPDGARVVFTSTRSGAEELWMSNADGSALRQMTSMGGPQCGNPQWSPDGETILFNSRREASADLYLLRPVTGEVRRLTTDPSEELEARWSRDGRSIYFSSDRTGRFEVWKMRVDGGAPVQITRGGGMTASESFDGRFLYYAKASVSPSSIWRVPVAGGEETLVTEGLTYALNFAVADRGLYFVAAGNSPREMSIDYIEFATGRRATLARVDKPSWYGAAWLPGEQAFVYSTVERAGSNLMLVEIVE